MGERQQRAFMRQFPLHTLSAVNTVLFGRHGYMRMREHGDPRWDLCHCLLGSAGSLQCLVTNTLSFQTVFREEYCSDLSENTIPRRSLQGDKTLWLNPCHGLGRPG